MSSRSKLTLGIVVSVTLLLVVVCTSVTLILVSPTPWNFSLEGEIRLYYDNASVVINRVSAGSEIRLIDLILLAALSR